MGAAGLLMSSVMAALGLSTAATVANAASTSVCNYVVASGSGAVASGGGATFIYNVAPGDTVTVDCNTSSGAADAAEASLLAGIGTTAVSATSEADTGTLTSLTPSTTD